MLKGSADSLTLIQTTETKSKSSHELSLLLLSLRSAGDNSRSAVSSKLNSDFFGESKTFRELIVDAD